MKAKNKVFKGNEIEEIQDENYNLDDGLREEYDLDKMSLKPNPFVSNNKIVVELLPEVAKYFKSSKQVNNYLLNQIKQFQQLMI